MALRSWRVGSYRRFGVLAFLAVLLGVPPGRALAVSFTDLPPALQALPQSTLLSLFSVSFESPSLAAEVARLRVHADPDGDPIAPCAGLAQVISAYQQTSDARRSLLDLAAIYVQRGDWQTAEAPFRYVMETRAGQSEARVAHFRLIELHRLWGTPPGVDVIEECRLAVEAYAGTPEEGLGRMMLADMLAAKKSSDAAYQEFERVLGDSPDRPYAAYARIRYAGALVDAGKAESALAVIAPALADPLWGGRASYARGRAYAQQEMVDAATADFERAALTADSLWFQSDAYRELARLYTKKGNVIKASECLQACLNSHPFRPDAPPLRVELLRNLVSLGDPVRVAAMATKLKRQVQNIKWRYSQEQIDYVVPACDEILKSCESAPPGSRGTEAGPAVDYAWADDPAVRLDLLRSLLATGNPARTAVMAMCLRIDVQNDEGLYAQDKYDAIVLGCKELEGQCEDALRSSYGALPMATAKAEPTLLLK